MKTKIPLPDKTNVPQPRSRRASETVRAGTAVKVDTRASAFLPLNKSTFEPFYVQILTQLRQQIQSGALGVHDPLPSEMDIARIFGVSRMTARQALQTLTNEGLAYRKRGSGTFIAPAKVEKEITHLLGFSAQMKLLGLKASTQVLVREVIPATQQLTSTLELQGEEEVLRLRRLRLAAGEPIALEEVWIPLSRFPGIQKKDFSKTSLYETMRDVYSCRIGSSKEIIEARSASTEESRLLRIPSRASLLVVSRTLLDVNSRPMEVSHSLYRGDRYRAMLTISAVGQD